MAAEVQGLISKFESIRRQSANLVKAIDDQRASGMIMESYLPYVRVLADLYNGASAQFIMLTSSKFSLDYAGFEYPTTMSGIKGIRTQTAVLETIVVNSDAALGHLQALSSPISPKELDKLEAQRKGISSIEDFDPKLYKHLIRAIEEHESGHYLCAALLAAKVSGYVLEQLDGKSDIEKAEHLIKNDLLSKDLKDNFVKGAKNARNYFTHDISAIAEPQDSLGLVYNACDLALKLQSLKEKKDSVQN